MEKFLALIPSRYGSSRFEGKPLVDIFGLPMVVRVYKQASQIFDNVYIATDDKRIEKVAIQYGCNVIMTSTSHRNGTDRCREALEKIEQQKGEKFDVVVNIQGDEPFINPQQLEQIKDCFLDKKTDIATLVKPFEADEDIFNPNSPKVTLSNKMFALYFSRSAIPFIRGSEKDKWQAEHQFYKHIGLYAYRTDVLREITELQMGDLEKCESLEQLRWLENGYRIKCSITTHKTYAIDTPEDLKMVLEAMKNV